jgi:Na+/H+ antiporter
MSEALLLLTFLTSVVVLTVLAKRFKIPYPIAFVIGGIGLAFSRNLPHPRLDPEIILLVVLPPLLYSAAWSTDWLELRRNWRPISLLAIGLVIFTTAVVAVVVHALVPGFGWPLAFTLGALVSPPDAVAAEAIFERIPIPRRIAAIVTGECLVNDATALVLYRFALAAAVSGAFSLAHASVAFVVVAVGGILIGLATSFIFEAALRFIARRGYDDATLGSVILLIAPFAAYLPAEHFGVSGVLAAVSAGIMLSRRSRHFIDSETRLQSSATWRVLTFILNGFAFLLIGLQMPAIMQALQPHVRDYALYGLLVAAVVICVRIVWVYPATYLPRLLSKRVRLRDPNPSWRSVAVIGWSGMRGIVSLAAALALPYTFGDRPFPERSQTIFFAVCVVFITLVLQGLTLGPLIEWLGLTESSHRRRRENAVRIVALQAGIRRLKALEAKREGAERERADRILEEYEQRLAVLRGKSEKDPNQEEEENLIDRRLEREALDAERHAIGELRRAGKIPDDVFRSIEYDLDLASLRLA